MSRTRISRQTINSKDAIIDTKSHGDPRMKAGMMLYLSQKERARRDG